MKKETLKELLDRLDEQAAQFNTHLTEANRLFDTAAKKVETLLVREEKQIHTTIQKIKKAMKGFGKEANNKPGKDKPA